jgi:NTP pyrophosphatase (non-canonical NTP hydrolase)
MSESADAAFLYDLGAELRRARAKFPQQSFWRTLAALTEEVGELNQAILQHRDYATIRGEAIQVAVMALRVANDCGLDLAVLD